MNGSNQDVQVSYDKRNFDFYNNIVVAHAEKVGEYNYTENGLYLNINKTAGYLFDIKNNIFTGYSKDHHQSAIWVTGRIKEAYGDVAFSHNNFYDNKQDIYFYANIAENLSPFNFNPAFNSDGSYRLASNSPLRNIGSDNIIHRNHNGAKNTLGIEGGLFYNTVPNAQVTISSKNSQVTLDASGSSDEQTPAEYLQYRWDYNNDGVFDTEFLLTPTHPVSSVELLGDTIAGWVFDEHFSMDYVKIPKTGMKVLPSDAKLALSVTGNAFCSGSAINLQPEVIGDFESDNLFTVELTDAVGNFANATILDCIYGKNIDESQLSITLPGNLPQGNYKLRLSSTDPIIHGQETNAFAVTFSQQPSISITANNREICEGTNVTFGANVQNTGSAKSYQWFVNEQSVGNDSPLFSTNALQDGDVVKVELSCTEGCFFPAILVSNEIAIRVKTKQTPIVEICTYNLEDPQPGEPVELFAFTENTGDNIIYEWYVNDILTGNNEPFITINYNSGTTVSVKVLCNADCSETNLAESSYMFSSIPIMSVSLNKTITALSVNDTEQLTATIEPENATNQNVTWSSSNTAVATVSNTGLVTAVSTGTTAITVITADGGYAASCEVTVMSETGIDNPEAAQIIMFPSPAKDILYIKGLAEGVKIEVTDLSGRHAGVHLIAPLQNGVIEINVSALPQGVYLVKSGGFAGKFVKQ
jgi:hypothetical protein